MLKRTIALFALLALLVPAWGQDREEPEEVTKIREMVPRLMESLEQIRGLTFEHDVTVNYQTDEEFRAYMRKSIDEEYPAERAHADVMLLAAVGLLPIGYDIREEMIDATSSQALAYYEPSLGAFFVLKTGMPLDMVEPMVLHELNHALQDQRFGLAEPMEELASAEAANEDQVLAFRFLVEGEATYTMTLYSLDKQGGARGMLDMTLRMQATMSRERMSMMERTQARLMGEDGAKMLEALDARDKLPHYIYHGLLDPYLKGAWFVHNIVEEGGMEAIDEAFRNPPSSTEQVLHPEKAIGPDRDEPVSLTLPDVSAQLGAGVSLIGRNTLGELNMRVIFKELGAGLQEAACAGWDGDRIHAYARGGDKEAQIVWLTTWDSEADAEEFAAALKKHQKKGPAPLAGATVQQNGADVLVLGVDEAAVDAVAAAVWAGAERSGETTAWFK